MLFRPCLKPCLGVGLFPSTNLWLRLHLKACPLSGFPTPGCLTSLYSPRAEQQTSEWPIMPEHSGADKSTLLPVHSTHLTAQASCYAVLRVSSTKGPSWSTSSLTMVSSPLAFFPCHMNESSLWISWPLFCGISALCWPYLESQLCDVCADPVAGPFCLGLQISPFSISHFITHWNISRRHMDTDIICNNNKKITIKSHYSNAIRARLGIYL